MLQQNWVKEWQGWVDAQILWHSDDDDMIHNIAEDIAIRFARISMNNVRISYMSDEMRQNYLRKQGFYIGKSFAHGEQNACLLDYLLQLF